MPNSSFDNVNEDPQIPISRWPYNWGTVEATLDHLEIQRQGEYFLYRALNTRSAVAFLGSGVSAAYARATWYEITKQHIDSVCEYLNKLSETGASHVEPVLKAIKSNLERLKSIQAQLKPNVSAEKLMMALQIAERFWATLPFDPRSRMARYARKTVGNPDIREGSPPEVGTYDLESAARACRIGHAFENFISSKAIDGASMDQPNFGRRLFQFWIQDQTFDELGFVESMLKESSDVLDASYAAQKPLVRKINEYLSEVRDTPRYLERESLSAPFQFTFSSDGITKLGDLLGENPSNTKLQKCFDPLRAALANSQQSKEIISPSQYYLFGLALSLNGLSKTENTKIFFPGPLAVSRAEKVDRSRDPLRILDHDLEIKRYATTNWDLEVERYFSSLGYKAPSFPAVAPSTDTSVDQVSPLGSKSREIVVDGQQSIELLDFAAHESVVEYQVAHLHGRSTSDSSIVVTERDYQYTYLRQSNERTIVREGIEVLFGGNPIFFVGLGMSEDDLMRPMRQFLSGDVRRNRSLVALMNPTKNWQDCETFAMGQFARYGVHITYFGDNIKIDSEESFGLDPSSTENERWLYQVFEWSQKLRNMCLSVSAILDQKKSKMRKLKRMSTSHDWLKIKRYRDSSSVRDIVNGAKVLCHGERVSVQLDFATLTSAHDFIDSLINTLKIVVKVEGLSEEFLAKFCANLGNSIDRAYGSIVNAVLCAKLKSMSLSWRQWWENWQVRPRYRADQIAFGPQLGVLTGGDHSPKDHPPIPTRWQFPKDRVWSRHSIQDRELLSDTEDEGDHGVGYFIACVNHFELSQTNPDKARVSQTNRRVFLVSGEKGVGKGAFFSRLSARASRREKRKGDEPLLIEIRSKEADSLLDGLNTLRPGANVKYSAYFSASFSFSSEIASVFDALTSFFLCPHSASTPVASMRDKTRKVGIDPISLGRMRTLRKSIEELRRTLAPEKTVSEDQPENRVLVVLNAIDILLDGDGYSKNAEIEEFLNILFSEDEAVKCAPLDLVLLCRSDRLPVRFRGDQRALDVRRARGECQESLIPLKMIELANLKLLSGTTTAIDAVAEGSRKARVERSFEALKERYKLDLKSSKPELQCANAEVRNAEKTQIYFHHVVPINYTASSVPFWLSTKAELNFSDDLELKRAISEAEETIHNALSHSRFLVTLLISTVREIIQNNSDKPHQISQLRQLSSGVKHSVASSKNGLGLRCVAFVLGNWFDIDSMSEAGRARSLLGELVVKHLAILGAPVEADVLLQCPEIGLLIDDNEETLCRPNVLGTMLEAELRYLSKSPIISLDKSKTYKENDWVGLKVSTEADLPKEVEKMPEPWRGALELYSALISSATSGDVKPSTFLPSERLLKRILLLQLTLIRLTRRGFAFHVGHRREDLGPAWLSRPQRFVTHRTVQEFVVSQLSAQDIGSSETNLFSVSLYSSHDRRLPTLNASAYAFLTELVEGLTAYPERSSYECFNKGHSSRCLRAAIGMLRTMMSIGVVLRFSDLDGLREPELSDQGYLERHRIVLRWLLFRAQELDSGTSSLAWIRKDLDAYNGLMKELVVTAPGDSPKSDLRISRLKSLVPRIRGKLEQVKNEAIDKEWLEACQKELELVGSFHENCLADCKASINQLLKNSSRLRESPTSNFHHCLDASKIITPRTAAIEALADTARKLRRDGHDAPPFYRDEVMWLYNECAVSSYTQGHIYDSHALFEKALTIASSIEGWTGGPMYRRILLNQGFSELDRGRIRAGQTRFERVIAESSVDDIVIRAVAETGRLTAQRLSGNPQGTLDGLKEVSNKLKEQERYRAAALAHLTLGLSLLDVGQTDRAEEEQENAVRLATLAAAEDVLCLGRIALTRLRLKRGQFDSAQWLDKVEQYARAMDMPRLTAEVLIARSETQIEVGEIASAAELATRALRITTLYGMRLKKLEALQIMTWVNKRRGNKDAADRLQARVLHSARDLGFLLLVQRAENPP